MIEAALAALAVIGVGTLLVRRGVNEAATVLCRQLEPHWTPQHEFCDVALEEVAGDDREALRDLTARLVRAGFRHLYDIQDLTMSSAKRSVYYRVFADDRGTTKSCVYVSSDEELRWTLESELGDGRFLVTHVAAPERRRADLSWLETLALVVGTDVEEALIRHRQRLDDLPAGEIPLALGDRDAALASWQRGVAHVADDLRQLTDPIVFERIYAHRPKWFERAVCREAVRRLERRLPAARMIGPG